MGLWQKPGRNAGPEDKPLGVSRAGVAGASLDELCQQAYLALSAVLDAKVERFGVWLVSGSAAHADGPLSMHSFQGRFWNNGREDGPPEWNSLGSHLPLPPSVHAGKSLEEEIDPAHFGILMGPREGMRRVLWVPVVFDGQLFGLIFIASRTATARFPVDEAEKVSAELALVLGFRAAVATAEWRATDLGEARKVWSKICAGVPADPVLQEITSECFRVASQKKPGGSFAMIGIPSADNVSPVSRGTPLEFRWAAGDGLAIRSAMGEPDAGIWQRALESKAVVGGDSHHPGSPRGFSRILALPLLNAKELAGVLVVGMDRDSASLASLARLDLLANLASASLTLSARKRATAAPEILEFLFQNCSEPIFVLDAKQQIVSTGALAGELLIETGAGCPPHDQLLRGEALLTGVARIFRSADRPRVSGWLAAIAESNLRGESRAISAELRNGKHVRLSAARLPTGGSILIAHAVKETRNDHGGRDAAELYGLIEWIDQGVLLFDEHGRLRSSNRQFSQFFGLSPEDLKNAASLRDLITLIAPRVSDPTRFAESWWKTADGIKPDVREEVRLVQPTGRLIERISRPLRNSAGTGLGRIEIYSDLTPQQFFQSKLHKIERLAALGQNVSGIAHELSNPLTTILGYAERLLRNSGGVERRTDIQRIFSEAERASSILRQLLDSSREVPLRRDPADLNMLILRTAELQRPQLAAERILLELDLAPSLPRVRIDSGQFQQILMNLISNSRHALLEQKIAGSISLRTRVNHSARVLVEFSDTGPGISEAHRHHVFEPFFTTKAPGIGTGLGLSIVMGLVRQNNGNIRVQSLSGKGATFLIDFPPVATDVPLILPELPAALSTIPRTATGRVLVVEDEPTVAQLVADMLSDFGFVSDIHQDPRRALVSALNRDYELVICDMKMPGLDGQHFFRALVEAGSPLTGKFLFITGDVLGISTQEFLRKQRLPHIAKPFRLEEFTEKISFVLGQSGASATARLETVGNFSKLSSKNLHGHG
jgi:signal transduction histidine kinase/CheY-like chemotaxis protein